MTKIATEAESQDRRLRTMSLEVHIFMLGDQKFKGLGKT